MKIMKAIIWIFFLVAFDFLNIELAFSQENLSKIKKLDNRFETQSLFISK